MRRAACVRLNAGKESPRPRASSAAAQRKRFFLTKRSHEKPVFSTENSVSSRLPHEIEPNQTYRRPASRPAWHNPPRPAKLNTRFGPGFRRRGTHNPGVLP